MRSDPPITSPKEREREADLSSNRGRGRSKRRVGGCSSSNASTSPQGSGRCSVRSSSVGGRSSLKKNSRESTRYAAHIPVFPNLREPTNILLEPFPNRHVRSMCSAGGLLITTHRNGIRIYRQRYLTPATAAAVANSRSNIRKVADHSNTKSSNSSANDRVDVRTGIWEAVDFRDNFNLQDAYLCVAAESVFSHGRLFPLKWNRYFAVACGSDRTRFSVCVMSVAAHFLLHHELHAKNKVVALNFALVAMEAKAESRQYQPFVVSVDEVGEVVIFDVERDRAVKLALAPGLAAAPSSASDSFHGDAGRSNACDESSHTIPTNKDKNNKGEKENDMFATSTNRTRPSLASGSLGTRTSTGTTTMTPLYRLETGVASNVCLIGPCQVLCRYCHNAGVGSSYGVTHPLPLSLFIASHAHSFGGSAAELHVTQLRIHYTAAAPRAIVVDATPIVREGVSESLCELGVALLRVPFHTRQRPPVLLLGRPRLRFWSLSGCSGNLLQLHRVYEDTDGSGMGARTPQEHFVQVVPLGRHTLLQDTTTSWLCIAALTDADVILLLGQQPRTMRGEKVDITPESSIAGPKLERQTLEAWLGDVEESEEKVSVNTPIPPLLSVLEGAKQGEQHPTENRGVSGESSSLLMPVSPPLTFMDPKEDYTVLMLLTPPCKGEMTSSSSTMTSLLTTTSPSSLKETRSFTHQLISVPQSNELLYSCDGSDAIYSIKLPFVGRMTSDETTTGRGPIPIPQSEATNTRDGWRGVSLAAGYLRDLNIARPLIAAMWNLAGEVELDEGSLPPVVVQPPQEEKNIENQQELKGQYPQQEQGQMSLEGVVKVTGEKAAGAVFSSRAAVPVYIEGISKGDGGGGINDVRNSSPSAHTGQKKKRRTRSSSVISMEERTTDVNHDDDVRRAYVKGEQRKFLDSPSWKRRGNSSNRLTVNNTDGNSNNNSDVNDLMSKKEGIEENSTNDAALLIQMVAMDEPLQRNAILYEWSDEHDDLYVQFTEEALEIVEKAREAAAVAGDNTIFQHTSDSLRDRPIIMREIKKGNQSAGFMQAFRHAQHTRQQLRDRGKAFDFSSYFASSVVPQRLLDLQENDRCRFELADLKAAFEDDMQEMREVETVVVYENEEREVDAGGRRRWRPHLTFPFDDENGAAVDFATLNATATLRKGTTATSTGAVSTPTTVGLPGASTLNTGVAGWRWAGTSDGGDTSRPSGSRLLRKELHPWRVGEWVYATRWPTREEELHGTFEWKKASDCMNAKVRRRRLSRDRINLALEAAKEQRRGEYMKKLEELRMELDL